MRDADAVNRAVVEGLGLSQMQFKNAAMQHHLYWVEGQKAGRPWRLDEDDLVALGVWIALTRQTKLSRAQATAISASIRTGLRSEKAADHWFIWYDHAEGKWLVATSPPVEMATIALNLGVVRDRIAELRAQAEVEMQE